MPVLFVDDPAGTPSRPIFRKVYQYTGTALDLYYTGGKVTMAYQAMKAKADAEAMAKKIAVAEAAAASGPEVISAEGFLNLTQDMGGSLPLILGAGLIFFFVMKR